ncbi:kinetochore protein Spc24 isoform 3, partial [Daubentonia madagascariensis]
GGLPRHRGGEPGAAQPAGRQPRRGAAAASAGAPRAGSAAAAGDARRRRAAAASQLTRELQELQEMEADLERQEREVDEDTIVTIPSAVYVAQLYHQVSKIEWDYESEPGMIKGSILFFWRNW